MYIIIKYYIIDGLVYRYIFVRDYFFLIFLNLLYAARPRNLTIVHGYYIYCSTSKSMAYILWHFRGFGIRKQSNKLYLLKGLSICTRAIGWNCHIINALEFLGKNPRGCGSMLIHLTTIKLDISTITAARETIAPKNEPS